MSYVALYRKWRPQSFDEVKGQDAIVTTLQNQVKHNRVGHAYLFCGTRGTGKTTLAKLLAKTINCENPKDGSPCGVCESCRAIAEGRSMNVVEIDAASNNGVDNVRQINSAVQYSPTQGNYLVYIIDEVHMLSAGAFNALLKTLEEPPGYVVFILATTEAHKIPVTIKSRCQRYDFRRIPLEVIADRLEELMRREEISATREALLYVAKAADGSMRDGLSILDQCVSFHLGEELTLDKVLATVGAVDIDTYLKLFSAVREENVSNAIDILDEVIWQGRDLAQFTSEFILFLRNMLMLKLSPDMKLDLTTENREAVKQAGSFVSEETLIGYINLLEETAGKLAWSFSKRTVLELAVIKLATPESRSDLSGYIARIESLEQKVRELAARPVSAAPQREATDPAEEAQTLSAEELSTAVRENLKQTLPAAVYADVLKLSEEWTGIFPTLSKFEQRYLADAKLVPDETGALTVFLSDAEENQQSINYFIGKNMDREKTMEHVQRFEDALSARCGRTVKVEFRVVKKESPEEKRVNMLDLTKIQFDDIQYED